MNQTLRRLLPLLVGLLIGPLGSGAAAQQLALRSDLWCPYSCEPAASEQGYFVDLVRAALPQAQIDYALGRWSDLRHQRSAPPAPVLLLLGMSITPQTRREFLFVQPSMATAQTCAFRRSGRDWWLRQPADLRGQRLGLTLGYSYHAEVDALLADPQARRLITELSGERASLSHARMLGLDRVDVVLEERAVMLWALRQRGMAADIVEAGCLPAQITDAMHLAVPRSDPRAPAIVQALQQGMARLQQNGELARLRQRYGL